MKKTKGFFVPCAGLLVAILVLLFTGLASASTDHLVFSTGGSGTIEYASVGGSLVGSGITVPSVAAWNGNTKGLSSDIDGGFLSFTTGVLGTHSTSGLYSTWTFGGGGTISISGSILNVTNGPVLMSGDFKSVVVTEIDFGVIKFDFVNASFKDTKDANLLKYFGLSSYTNFTGGLTMQFSAKVDPINFTFTTQPDGNVAPGSVTNYPVPIPATAWLLGSGLLGLLGVRRKRS